eukprot:CAMPEP_0181236132 /NCGR_PEP_ID=MMETSP1096-20121128/37992_1 /TAXON_ID=156174 ORGANISM="Chrysochromulina ericina, Strain CCMP281" /NCGR_SAMPLE_ID=MMETSP1096 /ASSEMBLY_ACC=CAM_ASM_000453 /LENGTH=84 /DNA_ID=CAMNT_0023331251 /DNA_START=302 /DNA_END=553 /DNA_ORIENTATION=-
MLQQYGVCLFVPQDPAFVHSTPSKASSSSPPHARARSTCDQSVRDQSMRDQSMREVKNERASTTVHLSGCELRVAALCMRPPAQ